MNQFSQDVVSGNRKHCEYPMRYWFPLQEKKFCYLHIHFSEVCFVCTTKKQKSIQLIDFLRTLQIEKANLLLFSFDFIDDAVVDAWLALENDVRLITIKRIVS